MPGSSLVKLIAGALCVLALGAFAYWSLSQSYHAGYAAGSTATDAEWKTHYNKLLENNQRLTKEVATAQHALDAQAAYFERKSHEEKQDLMDDYERRLAAVNNRVERVYIPAKIPDGYCDTAGVATAGAASRIREERCELDPAIVADLAGITHDGDIATIERNELIDRYNATRAALMQQQENHEKTR